MPDPAILVATSSTQAALISNEGTSDFGIQWSKSSKHPYVSAAWLKNGKAFLTVHGEIIDAHVRGGSEPPTPLFTGTPGLCSLSGDGKCLLLTNRNAPGVLEMVDLQINLAKPGTKASLGSLQDHDQPILAVASCSGTAFAATSSAGGRVVLHSIDARARQTLGALPCGEAVVAPKRSLAFSQGVNIRLAAGTDDGHVLVWQVPAGKQGPVQLPQRHQGRVMGVGFGTFKGDPAGALVSCSEGGELHVYDMRGFPNAKFGFKVALQVNVSTFSMRDDGQVMAIGTKDGRVGILRTEDLLAKQQHVTSSGAIIVKNLNTSVSVSSVAWLPPRPSRESRDSRDMTISAASASAAPPASGAGATAATAQAALERRISGAMASTTGLAQTADGASAAASSGAARKEATNYVPPAGLSRHSLSSGLGPDAQAGRADKRPTAAAQGTGTGQAAAPATTNVVPGEKPAVAASAASGLAESSRREIEQPHAGTSRAPVQPQQSAGQPQRDAHKVPPLVLPKAGPGPGTTGRVSDAGAGYKAPGGLEVSPTGEGRPGDGGDLISPPGRAPAPISGFPPPSMSSPRHHSPRPALAPSVPSGRAPLGSSAGDAATSMRLHFEDLRSEMRDLVRGLQADMVRQNLQLEMTLRADLAVLQQENLQLRDMVSNLGAQLSNALRFGLGQGLF